MGGEEGGANSVPIHLDLTKSVASVCILLNNKIFTK